MAESLDDGEFWLPPQFLTDDDVLMDLETDAYKSLFPLELPCRFGSFGFSSDLSSPVESVVGSTETESDEEEYLAGLTRQMAWSTLEDDWGQKGRAFNNENSKGLRLSGSPQSTLCAVGTGCGHRQWSSRGSPKCQSRLPSPPRTWDLLYAAAGEVARLRANEDLFNHGRGLLPPPRKSSPNLEVGGFHSSQSLSHQKLQATQFQQLKQQQMMRQRSASAWAALKQQQCHVVQNRGMNNNNTAEFVVSRTNSTRPLGLSPSAWPPVQQAGSQNGPGMRAVFLGNPTGKRECPGTGVFLPRRHGTPTESRKKPGCSTVLLPAKVVQALNLNLDEIGAQPRFNGGYTPDIDVAPRLRNGNVFSNQRRNFRPQQGMTHELRLPQEWTY
ncbi:hypothetical protein SLEP1_g21499 [Rubroshorea leprosula]|uniref:TIP41-like protein n=1 Tax=Rubroshorea leprosula TaxID=152421 RepID=A0AAV5JGT9_9ROSI|nr:hypothetical protein SLEP1_g21499 [Rubroshorea leprosula]